MCVRRGVAGYHGGDDGMAWEATAENWRRRRSAGAAEAVGEKPLETRICPLIGPIYPQVKFM